MGRTRIGEPVLVRLPDPVKALAMEEAKRTGVSMSEVIRRSLTAYLGTRTLDGKDISRRTET